MTLSRQFALVPLRDIVMFPGAEFPIYVGRESTLQSIKYSKRNDESKIAIFTQKEAEYSGSPTIQSLYPVGTLCRMTAIVEMQDKSMKVMLEGMERIALKEVEFKEATTMVSIESHPFTSTSDSKVDETLRSTIRTLFSSWNKDLVTNRDQPEWTNLCQANNTQELLKAVRSLFLCPRLSTESDFKRYEKVSNTQLNQAVFKRQRVLEENDESKHWDLIKEALQFDIICRSPVP